MIEYVNGIRQINDALTEFDELDVVNSKKALASSVLTILNNLSARTVATEHLIKGFSEILMQRIMEHPDRFGNDFLLDAVTKLAESNNSNASVLVKTLSPQKEGENIINVVLNNNLGTVSPSGGSGTMASFGIADGIKLQNVNAVYELAGQVLEAEAKAKQLQEMQDAIIDIAVVKDERE